MSSIVTELVIDSTKAVAGAADYSRAMDSAQAAMEKAMGGIAAAATKAKDTIASAGSTSLNLAPTLTMLGLGAGGATAAFIGLAEAVAKYSSGLAEMSLNAKRAGLDIEDFQKKQFAGQLQGLSTDKFA